MDVLSRVGTIQQRVAHRLATPYATTSTTQLIRCTVLIMDKSQTYLSTTHYIFLLLGGGGTTKPSLWYCGQGQEGSGRGQYMQIIHIISLSYCIFKTTHMEEAQKEKEKITNLISVSSTQQTTAPSHVIHQPKDRDRVFVFVYVCVL